MSCITRPLEQASQDIKKYIKTMRQKNFFIDCVMTSEKMVKVWENNS